MLVDALSTVLGLLTYCVVKLPLRLNIHQRAYYMYTYTLYLPIIVFALEIPGG